MDTQRLLKLTREGDTEAGRTLALQSQRTGSHALLWQAWDNLWRHGAEAQKEIAWAALERGVPPIVQACWELREQIRGSQKQLKGVLEFSHDKGFPTMASVRHHPDLFDEFPENAGRLMRIPGEVLAIVRGRADEYARQRKLIQKHYQEAEQDRTTFQVMNAEVRPDGPVEMDIQFSPMVPISSGPEIPISSIRERRFAMEELMLSPSKDSWIPTTESPKARLLHLCYGIAKACNDHKLALEVLPQACGEKWKKNLAEAWTREMYQESRARVVPTAAVVLFTEGPMTPQELEKRMVEDWKPTMMESAYGCFEELKEASWEGGGVFTTDEQGRVYPDQFWTFPLWRNLSKPPSLSGRITSLMTHMVQPLRSRRDYTSIGREIFKVETLPSGALPIYGK
jgi:hypothetical protein